jgi:hypothetical protein
MKNKIVILIIIICGIFCSGILLSQDLTIELFPANFYNNNIDSCIIVKTINNTDDTIFVILDPLNSDIVNSYEYRLFQTFNFNYQPNRIIFYKMPNTGYFEALSNTNISFIKFPKILLLAPTNSTVLKVNLGDSVLNSLQGSDWSIGRTICYAFKKEVFSLLSSKQEYLQKEFINSLVEKDTIILNLMFNFQVLDKIITNDNVIRETVRSSIQISDPCLYYYKNSSYSIDTVYYRSSYDSIIYLFNHTL